MKFDPTHLTSLFENATEGIILTNGAGNVVLVNPAAEKIFGYTAEELIGNPIEILIPQSARPHHHVLREGFYHKPSNRRMGQGRDLYGKRKDGSDIPVEVSLSFYHKGEELFVIAFIVDITERKKTERNILAHQEALENMTESFRRLNTQLEAKVEERTLILKEALQKLEESQKDLNEALDKEKHLSEIKSRFVSMASHEFRTPLSTVLSSASLLSRYVTTEDQEKRSRHVEKIKNSVKHLNDILEDFLSLGKLDEGKVNTHNSLFDLGELVTETADEMRGLLKQDQHFTLGGNLSVFVSCDKKLLKNIIINLISNAIKFSGEAQAIDISSSATTDEIRVTVKDHGIGISEEDQVHLYSSFFRGKNATNIQGTGLGLHIIKRYLELLAGTITLQSAIGTGSSFTIIVPQSAETI